MKIIGYWCNDNSIKLVKIKRKIYALYGWNGEKYLHCWRCMDKYTAVDDDTEYEIRPIYNRKFDIVGYEVI